MSFAQLDKIADAINLVFPLALLGAAIGFERKRAPLFILKTALAFLVCQQIAKWLQKSEVLGDNFPSTHFAVCLVFATSLFCLRRKWWPLALFVPLFYGALMLYVHAVFGKYHTPLELLGAFYAIPLTFLIHRIGSKKRIEAPSN